jgi:Tfp pilus assembly protein PilN
VKPVNLLPQDQRRRAPREGGKGAYAVVGVLAVLLAMVAAYVLTSNQVTERENQTAAAGAEADRLEAEAAEQANFTDFAQIAQTRLASVSGVAETRFDWERLMRELSRIMPAGSWLQSTDASVTGVAGSSSAAGTTTTTTTAAPAAPSATLVGCTPDQSDVARMMVRLRQLHRVEDVSLNESLQEAEGEAATVDNCGRFYKFDLTVTFSPTAPASEAPRGAANVPASLGGGS